MSLEQTKDFVSGLAELSKNFKADSKEMADTYKEAINASSDKYEEVHPQVKEAATDFQTASHAFAQGMIDLAGHYVSNVDSLYKSTYPDSVTDTKKKK